MLPRVTVPFPESPKQVLFIRPGGIGDAVLLIPSIIAFSKYFPAAQIEVLAEKRNAQIFDFCTNINHVYCYDCLADWLSIVKKSYDVVVDSEQWYRLSAVFGSVFAGRTLVGFGTNERTRLLTCAIDYDVNRYEAYSFLSLLSPWKIDSHKNFHTPFLSLPKEGRERVLLLIKDFLDAPFIVLCPGGSRPEKGWGEEKFTELAERLARQGLKSVILGGPDDLSLARTIAERSGGLCLAGGTSLFESAVILEKSSIVVANDTGLLHLAVGLGRHTVSLFGPSNRLKWAPRGTGHRAVSAGCDCSPCSKFGNVPHCKRGVQCMHDISVTQVIAAVESLGC